MDQFNYIRIVKNVINCIFFLNRSIIVLHEILLYNFCPKMPWEKY